MSIAKDVSAQTGFANRRHCTAVPLFLSRFNYVDRRGTQILKSNASVDAAPSISLDSLFTEI